jgi:hypothetical protein
MIDRRIFGPIEHGITRPFARADLEIYGINTFRPSYTVHVFLNDTSVRSLDRVDERPSYAGRFSLFGHAKCVGDDDHCHVTLTTRRFDDRPSHPLTPAFRRVVITEALKKAIQIGKSLRITFLAGTPAEKGDFDGKYLVEFTGIQIVTFE